MDLPTLNIRTSHFPILEVLDGILSFFYLKILMEHSVGKQWWSWSDTA